MYFVLSQCQLNIGFAINLPCQLLTAMLNIFLSANAKFNCAALGLEEGAQALQPFDSS